ncbi:MAG TPA: Smr/MutS family protein [Candidatus Acidoferrales bacterium]|nr:Smr/MutS family protein [Candidatus Acidoferrales bacterium]
MSKSALQLLEFDRLREIVRGNTTCAPGRRRTEALVPSHDRHTLENDFALIREAREWLRGGSQLGFGALADPELWLARLRQESAGAAASTAVLTPLELLDAASLAETAGWLREYFRESKGDFPRLDERTALVGDFRPILTSIRKAILPDGAISDDASPELRKIRNAQARTRDGIQKTLREILRARGADAGEDYVTLRNDRYVIPVRAADRRASGMRDAIVHGASATGQTIFVEPLAAIELNNRLVQLSEDEAAEIARILADLTDMLRAQSAALQFAADTIAELDSIFARARFAREYDCALPMFRDDGVLKLTTARHPVLEARLRAEGGEIVPMTLELGGAETVLIISGPNTGGKSVTLKTVGLAALVAQSAIPVAAQAAEMPLFDRVLADIGDEQSIAENLSTFSAHILNLRGMLAAATSQSLVLMDELGTGTAPEEGAAIAVALLEEFRKRRCLTIATTHHDRLKAWASSTPGVVNAAVEFDEVNLQPTHRLMVGVPGGSSAIAIAERLGLPHEIIAKAREQITPESREAADLIAYLHRSREEVDRLRRELREQADGLERERTELQTEWVARQKRRIAELEEKFNEALKQQELAMERAIAGVKERELRAQIEKQAKRAAVKVRSEARNELDDAIVQHLSESQADLGPAAAPAEKDVDASRLEAGTRVRVKGFPSPVVLRRVDGRLGEVEAGPLRMKISLDDVTAVVENEPAKSNSFLRLAPSAVRVHSSTEEPATDEINVIGCTVEEASERVDKFIDQAAVAGKPRVRVIHGHGTGALRRGLGEFLAGHPLVQSAVAEAADRGGTAVTVVTLKD